MTKRHKVEATVVIGVIVWTALILSAFIGTIILIAIK